jgi:hypothetical protein
VSAGADFEPKYLMSGSRRWLIVVVFEILMAGSEWLHEQTA